MKIKEKVRVQYNIAMLKISVLCGKIKREVLKLSFAVVVFEFLIVGGWYVAEKKGLLEVFRPKTIIINNAMAKSHTLDEVNATKIVASSNAIFTSYNAEVAQTDSDPFTMASGKRVYEGAVASNCYPLGTKIETELGVFTVEDRMNKRFTELCGTDKERIDIFKWNKADNITKRLNFKVK